MNLLREYVRELLTEQVKLPPTLYHASYGPLADSIQQSGLGGDRDTMWEDSVRGTVYLALDPEIAFSYAETSDDAWDKFETDAGLEIVTFEIDTSNRDYFNLIDPDAFDQDAETWTWVLSITADMDANDTAKVRFYQGSGTAQLDVSTASFFTGVLIC